MFKRKKAVEGNQKVRNATPTEFDGIKFRSKIEAFTYNALKKENISVEYEKHRFTLLPSFKFNDATNRAITLTPDFVGDGFVIECKGFPNDAFPLKWKLFQYWLSYMKPDTKLYLVHTQKEVLECLNQIKISTLCQKC